MKIGKPVVVAQAPVEIDRMGGGWGRWQFPYLSRLRDGRLRVTFSIEPDSVWSRGKPVGQAYSDDEGRTWHAGPPQVGHEAADGLLLPNGDRLQPMVISVPRAEDFDLPKSVCDYLFWGYPRSLYRAEDLPAEVNEWRFRRLRPGESEWIEEVADMRIPDELRSVTNEEARRSGTAHGCDGIEQVRQGALSTPFLMGKMRLAPDGSLWAANYDTRLHAGKPLYTPLFIRSVDQGHTWDYLGEIPYSGDPGADPQADKREGFTEPDYNFRPDGSVICLMRTSDGYGHGPLYLARSVDGARTWSNPVVFDRSFDGGKMPQLLTLDNGVTLASYGQSGGPRHIAVRATTDPAGLDWGPPVHAHLSPPAPEGWNSCGHTEMVALGRNRALLVYSDFNYPDAEERPRKTILVRMIETDAD